MIPREIPPDYGRLWFKAAFALLKTRPIFFFAVAFMELLFTLTSEQIPYLGVLLTPVLETTLGVGLLLITKQSLEKKKASYSDLFHVFRSGTLFTRLLPLCGFFIVINVVCKALPQDPIGFKIGAELLKVLIGCTAFFSAPLIVFQNMTFLQTVRPNLRALKLNSVPILSALVWFILYGLLALLPLGLGLFVYIPVASLIGYFVYATIFEGLDIDRNPHAN